MRDADVLDVLVRGAGEQMDDEETAHSGGLGGVGWVSHSEE